MRLSRITRELCHARLVCGSDRPRERSAGHRMPIYELDGERPDLPAEGQYWLAETAVLIGRVRLLPNANVWYGSTLRGDNEWIELGEGSNIQENCTLHTDMGFPLTIARSCTIGHNVILHGCTIGENSLIGMGATLLNGARIGKNCLVDAGARGAPAHCRSHRAAYRCGGTLRRALAAICQRAKAHQLKSIWTGLAKI